MKKPVEDLSAAYCIDTNILFEFISLEQIPWNELAPAANRIRIIIPTKVAEEVDQQKKKAGRLRRRALEFNKLSRRIEDSANGVLTILEGTPRVTVEFGPLFRKIDLDSDQFDLGDNDNRIVAEAYAISLMTPGLTFISDDSKPARLARQAGLAFRRPRDAWRRSDPPDERDTEILRLKKELGALPRLSVAVDNESSGTPIVIKDGPSDTDPSCAKAMLGAIKEISL